jgi:virulence factor Mce-like protein
MRRRNAGTVLASSPTMVGAITVLIAIVTVFLAYNANSGLPFVPTYNISAQLPDADKLVTGNEVRIGGVRVGQITEITPETDPETGELYAQLELALDPDIEPLPMDSTVTVRARSALGLKYLEINQGVSSDGYAQGSIIPVSAAREPGDIEDFLNIFDEPTQDAVQANLVAFGNALAGRGPDLNAALGELPATLEFLEPVMENLSAPDTRLERFVVTLAAAAGEVAPVAREQAEMFVNLDTTFTALASVAPSLSETIAETPPTFIVATETMPTIRPFLANSAALFNELEPGIEALTASAPTTAQALEAGVAPLNDSPKLNRELAPTAESLQNFNDDATVRSGLSRLEQTMDVFGPAIKYIGPSQTVCNYWSILFTNLASATSVGGRDGGRWQRVTVFEPPEGPNNEGSLASAPANGGPDVENFLHFNPYPNTASPSQSPIECEAGNEPYLTGQQVIGNVPGNQGINTALQLPSQLKRGGG